MSNNNDRFELIMQGVDSWAHRHAGWDCRDEAVAEVNFMLNDSGCSKFTTEQMIDIAIATWQEAE